jgi:hypothetical protein
VRTHHSTPQQSCEQKSWILPRCLIIPECRAAEAGMLPHYIMVMSGPRWCKWRAGDSIILYLEFPMEKTSGNFLQSHVSTLARCLVWRLWTQWTKVSSHASFCFQEISSIYSALGSLCMCDSWSFVLVCLTLDIFFYLFTCAYIVWAISPPSCLHPLPPPLLPGRTCSTLISNFVEEIT